MFIKITPVDTGDTFSTRWTRKPNQVFLSDLAIEKAKERYANLSLFKERFTLKKTYGGQYMTNDSLDTALTDVKDDLLRVDALAATFSDVFTKAKATVLQTLSAANKLVKRIDSTLDSVALYNEFYFNDTWPLLEDFKNVSSVISGDLFVNQSNDMLSLPVDKVTEIPPQALNIRLLPQSKGVFDSTFTIDNIVDGDEGSYAIFYQDAASAEALLGLEITLEKTSLINQFSLKMNSFGSQNWATLQSIEISNDEKTFVPVLISAKELSGANNHFFSFLPLFAKKIRLFFIQDKLDATTSQYRIGINEIRLLGTSYKGSGSIIFKKTFASPVIPSNLSLATKFSVFHKDLFDMKYSVSFNGSQWTAIQPFEVASVGPEIVHVNQDWQQNNITLPSAVDGVYLKIEAAKNSSLTAVNELYGSMEFTEKEPYKLSTAAAKTLYSVMKDEAGVNQISVHALTNVSLGITGKNLIPIGLTKPLQFDYSIDIPFSVNKTESVSIMGVPIPSAADLNALKFMEMGYFIDNKKFYLHFRYISIDDLPSVEPWANITGHNLISGDEQKVIVVNKFIRDLCNNQAINLLLDTDTLVWLHDATFALNFASTGIKSDFNVYNVELENDGTIKLEATIDMVPAGATVIPLTGVPYPQVTASYNNNTGSEVKFIDGYTEFLKEWEGAFSIDYPNKTMHLKKPLEQDVTVIYQRQSKTLVPKNHYTLSDNCDAVIFNDDYPVTGHQFMASYPIALTVDPALYTLSKDQQTVIFKPEIIDSIYCTPVLNPDKAFTIQYKHKINAAQYSQQFFSLLTFFMDKFIIGYTL